MSSLNSGIQAACPSLDATAVKEIIETALTDAQINAFINLAYYQVLPIASSLGNCGGSAAFCEIAKLVAAHMITLRERMAKSESVAGEWSISYMAKDGMGLEASLYGQQAIAMDCSGALSKSNLKGVSLEVISYDDFADDNVQDENN